jgi:hypothetical protein
MRAHKTGIPGLLGIDYNQSGSPLVSKTIAFIISERFVEISSAIIIF